MTDPTMTTILQNVEDELKGGSPMPGQPSAPSIEKFVPSKYRGGGDVTFDGLKRDLDKGYTDQIEKLRQIIDWANKRIAAIEDLRRTLG